MNLLIGGLIVLGLIVISLLCMTGIYFIVLLIGSIKEAIEDLKD